MKQYGIDMMMIILLVLLINIVLCINVLYFVYANVENKYGNYKSDINNYVYLHYIVYYYSLYYIICIYWILSFTYYDWMWGREYKQLFFFLQNALFSLIYGFRSYYNF